METSAWCLMEVVSGQTGNNISCILHIIQVYLKNTIRIIMTRTQKSLNVIDPINSYIHGLFPW